LAGQRAARNKVAPPRRAVRQIIADEPGSALNAATGVRPHAALRRRLLAALVPRELCESWLTHVPEQPTTERGRAGEEERLRGVIRGTLGEPLQLCASGSRVAALIGPTGVGKTTTVAKLAARATLVENKRVAIVSDDDVRIGGTAALRAYANVLGVPMTTSTAEGGLAHALARFAAADLVLIDTAGLSPGRAQDFGELARRLGRAGEPVTTHLCVAASTRNEELDRILHLYGAASPHAVLPTKLDEAVAIGTVLAARTRLGVPLSFATTGQQVPDDIALASPDFIIDLLLGDDRT
jgi:flagellar biosynthesis protein FlhF